ncbi:MAG: MBL fold metallo-hydrolase [Muribaculaceae bacterium]
MKIWYLGHSGFAIECGNGCTMVFDFYNDTAKVLPDVLARSSTVYVLVSHSHPDHFNQRIFAWQSQFPNASFRFIIANELNRKLKRKPLPDTPPEALTALRRGDNWCDEAISVDAFGSTDIGVSYMVTFADGSHIFHAGDLNNWHWSEESTPQEIKAAQGNFLAILRDIKANFPAIDLAMFPVDPRIGGDFALGARQFVHAITTKHFIPMHQWGDFEKSCQFELYRQSSGNYHCMHPGETITI